MPMSPRFASRLAEALPRLVDHFGTPFYLYDQEGIDAGCASFASALRTLGSVSGVRAREYFAVKALPNPAVLRILAGHGFGFDCSSLPELELVRRAGAEPSDVFFTSSNTSAEELRAVADTGVRITIDDESVLDRLEESGATPAALTFRINPGALAPTSDQTLFGSPETAKFGIPTPRLTDVVRRAVEQGVERVGVHMMIAANTLDVAPILFTLDHVLDQVDLIRSELGVTVDIVNIGGGFGIPYRPEEEPLDLDDLFRGIADRAPRLSGPGAPVLCFENGRYLTGPHGVLVTSVVNRMSKWREFVGVDVSVTAMLRAAVYSGVHHHVTAPLVTSTTTEHVDVVGSLCTNADRLAIDRDLPVLAAGDVLVVHDLGAHGHAMGATYNARLRPAELLLTTVGDAELIRRAETSDDYFATLAFPPRQVPVLAAVGAAADHTPTSPSDNWSTTR